MYKMGKLLIGWSEMDLTPKKHVALAGQFAERISEYVEKPITATAMAVSDGAEQMIFVSCDLIFTTSNLVDAVRKNLVNNQIGIVPEKVIISAIHTHTGPVYPREKGAISSASARVQLEKFLKDGQRYIEKQEVSHNCDIATGEEVFEFLVSQITDVIIDAWQKKTFASFSNAFGRAPVGMCRRAVYSDGSAQMWGETNNATFTELEGGNDSGIELMYVFDDKEKLSGIVANLSCPAQCVQHRLFISPDLWGEVKKLLREHFGEEIFLLPLCSAAGDQCPVDLIRWVQPESDVNDPNIDRKYPLDRKADPSMFDIKGMKLVGKRIARKIISVYEEGLDDCQATVEFKHERHLMKLPLRRVTPEQVKNAERAIREYLNEKCGDVDYIDAAKLQVHLGILRRAELQHSVNVHSAEVHIIKFGTVAIATNPFELFLDYGNRIKARSCAEQTFLIQLACGADGYLPTEKAEQGGHYSAFVSSGLVGHEGGDILVRETLDAINKLF